MNKRFVLKFTALHRSWTTEGQVATVELALLQDADVVHAIGTVPNVGVVNWVVSVKLTAGSYDLRVRSTAANQADVTASHPVNLITSTSTTPLTVVQPIGGEYYEQGQTMRVQWESDASITSVSIVLRSKLNPSLNIQVADADVDNTNSFEWDVDAGGIAGAFFTVTGMTSSSTSVAANSGIVQILEPQPRISNVNLFVNSLGAVWSRGLRQTIRYNSTAVLQNVALELYERTTLKQVLLQVPTGRDMQYEVPMVAPPSDSSSYHAKISSLEFPFTYGLSDTVFALNSYSYYEDSSQIDSTSIVLTNPGSTLIKRRQYNIEWDSSAVGFLSLTLWQNTELVK